jgi:hypothetical protein
MNGLFYGSIYMFVFMICTIYPELYSGKPYLHIISYELSGNSIFESRNTIVNKI